jgi:hypothetical protein
VNAAVQEYNATLDRYFEDLARADNPATIVARAEALPAAPDLDDVRAQARARAVSLLAERDEEPAAVEAPIADAAPVAEAAIEASPTGETLMSEATMGEVGAVAEVSAPIAETSVETPAEAPARAEAPEMAAPTMAEADAETTEPVIGPDTLIGDTPSSEAPAATTEMPSPAAEPVPVMDPAATANSTWPAPAPEPEPEPVAASVDHTSAAVRLLRSVAPWTAPTHTGSNDKSESE